MEARRRLQASGQAEHDEKYRRDVAGKRPAQRGSLHDAEPSSDASRLDFNLWLLLTVENWLLDFGRPLYGLYVSEMFPLSLPGIGDYCHMAYNVLTAFILLKLCERCSRPVPSALQNLLVIFFVMGASIHLVGDSIQHRLIHSGYKLHLSVRDNPIMKTLKPASLIETFELIYFYDEQLGHEMWYIPLFITYAVYFAGCFVPAGGREGALGVSGWMLVVFSAGFEWYLVTEGQIFPIFTITLLVMLCLLLWRHQQGLMMDCNAKFLLWRSLLTLLAVCCWVVWLWNDAPLRAKYPGWLYVPEPWSYVSLYIMKL